MKEDKIKKRKFFMLVVLVIALIFMFWFNSQSKQSHDLPDQFVLEDTTDVSQSTATSSTNDEESTVSSSEVYESTYNGEQDTAARFAATYLSFSKNSLDSIKDIIDPTLRSKLEQLEGEEQEIDTLSLLDKSKLEEKNVYVFEFTAILKDSKKTKKSGKIFIIMAPQTDDKKPAIVSDMEWTYEA